MSFGIQLSITLIHFLPLHTSHSSSLSDFPIVIFISSITLIITEDTITSHNPIKCHHNQNEDIILFMFTLTYSPCWKQGQSRIIELIIGTPSASIFSISFHLLAKVFLQKQNFVQTDVLKRKLKRKSQSLGFFSRRTSPGFFAFFAKYCQKFLICINLYNP